MYSPHVFEKLAKSKINFIKSLIFKKKRIQKGIFFVEGSKNILSLLSSDYHIHMVVGTAEFLATHYDKISKRTQEIFQADADLLAYLGTFQSNQTGLAVATMKAFFPIELAQKEYGIMLDRIQDPGNLGTIIRIADWYAIKYIICSLDTVDLYNPKVLHASMGSFTNVNVYYTNLLEYLPHCVGPVLGTFTVGTSIYQADLPVGGWVMFGNEASGISKKLLPYIQHRISIPKYGRAESLNAAVATAVICDNLRRRISDAL